MADPHELPLGPSPAVAIIEINTALLTVKLLMSMSGMERGFRMDLGQHRLLS
jgi:hypothetical protein